MKKALQQLKAWAKRNANHLRGGIAAGVSVAVQVMAAGSPDEIAHWTAKRWAIGVGFVVLPYVHGWLTPGASVSPQAQAAVEVYGQALLTPGAQPAPSASPPVAAP